MRIRAIVHFARSPRVFPAAFVMMKLRKFRGALQFRLE